MFTEEQLEDMTMSLLDKLGQGVPIAIIGYVMVFVVLGILWAVIELMRVILSPKSPKTAKEAVTAAKVQEKADAPVAEVVETEQMDEGELVAVLTAAVAASLNTSTYNLRIKSFKRIDTKNNAWSNASRNDAINKF